MISASSISKVNELSLNDINALLRGGIKATVAKAKKKQKKTVVNATPEEQEKKMKQE